MSECDVSRVSISVCEHGGLWSVQLCHLLGANSGTRWHYLRLSKEKKTFSLQIDVLSHGGLIVRLSHAKTKWASWKYDLGWCSPRKAIVERTQSTGDI